ncbi:hypothetical protein QYF61_017379 [Mycteria americana]|uniref:Uncharacterized protein n=1 Tax=Mycteria americana TaxID=33587 RepID=A0AAN7NQD1_MYCAM|nr:hypothetical protein QYF61_017379 [Mycteria americana]
MGDIWGDSDEASVDEMEEVEERSLIPDFGDSVFLSDGPAGNQSITSQVAYWAGVIHLKEEEESVTIRIRGLWELAEGLQKSACIQAMYERGQQGIPMAAPVDPAHLRPLIRQLPDALKILIP